MPRAPDTIPAPTARRLLMGGQGLLADPARPATPAAVHGQIEAMGFVQVDTINIVERAHHTILRTRFDHYEPHLLHGLLERDRKLFEHWTHDASVIPVCWFHCWRVRFDRYDRNGLRSNPWWARRMGGDPRPVIDHVLERIESEGPLMSRDFEHQRPEGENGAWWAWKPQKAALEFLWRCGRLSVARRENFHKVYDLTERVFPALNDRPAPAPEEHVDWACRAALERLGAATPGELAAFFGSISRVDAGRWCRTALARGDVVEVHVAPHPDAGNAKVRTSVAFPDWSRRAARLPDPPDRLRLLSPFDPLIRDRDRAERLFGFRYRFEAFVPAARRTHGYYVLPILEGDRLVGRLDPRLDRHRGLLEVQGLWWEPKVRPTRARRAALEDEIAHFGAAIGAAEYELPAG